MKKIMALSLAVFFVVFIILLIGCASSKPKTKVGELTCISGCELPKWVDNPSSEDTKTLKAVIGVSKNFTMESSARSDAILQAKKEVISLMSSYVKTKVNEMLSSAGVSDDIINEGVVRDEAIKSISEGYFEGSVKQYHIQRWEKQMSSGVKNFYKAYALVLYPKDLPKRSIEKALQKQLDIPRSDQEKQNIERALEKIKEMDNPNW